MSAKTKRIERSQRFRRLRRGENRQRAVSPVVATLILILIAVAAAAALYLWLVAWQGNITGGIGQPSAQYTVTIGGSTSVYPFDTAAVTQFEQNNSDVVVSNNQGGTGAGMLAVCSGQVDIGTASSLETPAGLQASDGCPTSQNTAPVVQIFAYDAVDVIVQNANPHGLHSISYDTLAFIYQTQTTTGTPTLKANSMNEVAFPTGYPMVASGALAWDQIPACVSGVVSCASGFTEATTAAPTTGANVTITIGGGTPCGSDTCATPAAGAATSPCGWAVCAGGTGTALATASIDTVARSDASGTTQTFEARVLGATSATQFDLTTSLGAATASFTGLGFSGCGSNNLISDCGYAATKTANGNPGVISTVAGDPNAIGYASDGLARASTSGVTCQGIATSACGIGLQVPGQSAAVQPALGASGSIAGGIVNGGFGTPGLTTTLSISASYGGARPFSYVTLGAPTGEVQRFINFVLDPANNIDIAAETAEVSIYSI
jgi:flagellin-like protein